MSDSMSTISCGVSKVPYSTNTNLNPLTSMNSMFLAKIKKEIENYIGVSAKCKTIWEALQKNQIAGSRLSQKVIEVVFKQFEADIYNYTRVSSLKDFMRLFDVDKDGFLNQDEQVSIFSYVKQRVEITANNALVIQAYHNFQALMKEVRQLQKLVSKWQNDLRIKIHQGQIQKYKQRGQQRIDDFCFKYDQMFTQLMDTKVNRKAFFEQQAMQEINFLDERLQNSTEYIRIKPKSKVKYLQMQQKLVALQQRVEEALDFRKQLNQLQVEQKQRVDKMIIHKGENLKLNLRKKHEKARKQLQLKLDQLENRLIIKMKREYDVLLKKNSLHQNEIKRLQNIMGKWAVKKGTFYPQLKRTKNLERKRNQIIGDFKQVTKKQSNDIVMEEQAASNANTKMSAKSLLQQTTTFQISKKSLVDLPINVNSFGASRSSDGKIGRYLSSQKSLKQISLCKLYDENLKSLFDVAPAQNQHIYKAEVNRKRNFILSKIL